MFLTHRSNLATFYFGLLPAASVVRTCTSSREIYPRFSRNSSQVTRSREKSSKMQPQSCRSERVSASPGWAGSMGIAGTASMEWRGYAEYALARTDFTFPLPAGLDDVHVAPLLCAGIIGFRSLRVAGVEPGERVGLFGFGSSASLAITILQSWKCDVYVVTRGESHRNTAASLGATWVGDEDAKLPVQLDRAITFAPSGKVVVSALSSLRKGGVVAINAIHLDHIPTFDYDTLLWGERQLRSVANMTREDARDFLKIARDLHIRPQVTVFSLEEANKALQAVKEETGHGSAVIVP